MGVDIGCSGVGMVVGMVVGEVDRGSTTHQSEERITVQAGASNGDSVWACVARWRSVRSGYGVVDACVAVLGYGFVGTPTPSLCGQHVQSTVSDLFVRGQELRFHFVAPGIRFLRGADSCSGALASSE